MTSPAPDRNAIGVHAGTYSTYRALAVATGDLPPSHQPDYHGTQPAVVVGPFPQWSDPLKIVTFDPWGHRTPTGLPRRYSGGPQVAPVDRHHHRQTCDCRDYPSDGARRPEGRWHLSAGKR